MDVANQGRDLLKLNNFDAAPMYINDSAIAVNKITPNGLMLAIYNEANSRWDCIVNPRYENSAYYANNSTVTPIEDSPGRYLIDLSIEDYTENVGNIIYVTLYEDIPKGTDCDIAINGSFRHGIMGESYWIYGEYDPNNTDSAINLPIDFHAGECLKFIVTANGPYLYYTLDTNSKYAAHSEIYTLTAHANEFELQSHGVYGLNAIDVTPYETGPYLVEYLNLLNYACVLATLNNQKVRSIVYLGNNAVELTCSGFLQYGESMLDLLPMFTGSIIIPDGNLLTVSISAILYPGTDDNGQLSWSIVGIGCDPLAQALGDIVVDGQNIEFYDLHGELVHEFSTQDKNVKQNATSASGNFPILAATAGTTATMTGEAYFNSGVYIKPSTASIVATKFEGTATKASTAAQTDKTLVLKANSGATEGSGLWTFNGSADKTINIVGDGATSVTASNGTITISSTNTIYTHPTGAGHYHIPSGGATGQVLKYNGSSGTAKWENEYSYTLPLATYNTRGGVKPAYTSTGAAVLTTTAASNTNTPTIVARTTTADRFYGVEADKNGVLFVNVPWSNTNTTYTAGTGLTLSGTTFNHTNSIEGGTVGAAATPSHGGKFSIPQISYDSEGHITSATTVDITLPADSDTHYTSQLYVGAAAGAKANAAATNGNVYLNLVENGTVRNAHKIVGSGATSVTSDTNGHITISSANTTYDAATQSAAGLMSAADKKKLDGVEEGANAYSHPTTAGNKHIPSGGSSGQILRWSSSGTAVWGAENNTTYNVVTASANGLAPMFDAADGTIDDSANDWVLTNKSGTLGWYKLPANAFKYRTYSAATSSTNGLMSSTDKAKLDAITESADAVSFTQTKTSGTEVGKITINGTTTTLYCNNDTNTDTKVQTAAQSSTTIYVTGCTGTSTGTSLQYNSSVYISGSVLYGAAWNDYAEFRKTVVDAKAGQVVIENGDDSLSLATERLQPGANIVSDTYGFAIGETSTTKTPLAVSGRVLAYTWEPRETFSAGDPVCSGPNGTVSKMTREEVMMYPDRMIGTVSAVPNYEVWGTGNVKVNGRIWIKI